MNAAGRDVAYQPRQQVLDYLRDNGFRTYIVSGGGADFMRARSERVYGIPPEQGVGSTGTTRFEIHNGTPVLVKTMDYVFVDDEAGQPSGIDEFIARAIDSGGRQQRQRWGSSTPRSRIRRRPGSW